VSRLVDYVALAALAGVVAYLVLGTLQDILRHERARRALRSRRGAEYLQAVGLLASVETPDDLHFRQQIRINRYVAKRAGRRPSRVVWA
jgi:hypothetical protein